MRNDLKWEGGMRNAELKLLRHKILAFAKKLDIRNIKTEILLFKSISNLKPLMQF